MVGDIRIDMEILHWIENKKALDKFDQVQHFVNEYTRRRKKKNLIEEYLSNLLPLNIDSFNR